MPCPNCGFSCWEPDDERRDAPPEAWRAAVPPRAGRGGAGEPEGDGSDGSPYRFVPVYGADLSWILGQQSAAAPTELQRAATLAAGGALGGGTIAARVRRHREWTVEPAARMSSAPALAPTVGSVPMAQLGADLNTRPFATMSFLSWWGRVRAGGHSRRALRHAERQALACFTDVYHEVLLLPSMLDALTDPEVSGTALPERLDDLWAQLRRTPFYRAHVHRVGFRCTLLHEGARGDLSPWVVALGEVCSDYLWLQRAVVEDVRVANAKRGTDLWIEALAAMDASADCAVEQEMGRVLRPQPVFRALSAPLRRALAPFADARPPHYREGVFASRG